ncbi:Phosphate-specific transport system accessory protein PhoU [Candidatus Zixiibacteriota bacterium]|nr:Phosphate-specific transport system accessory protein PhoU [candidate division Zixibacteria bacterium]
MAKHLQREIDKLKKKILALSAVVEESVNHAVRSISARDLRLADKVMDGDKEIDQMEVDVEEECLKILALDQPVAIDLRFIIAVLKINNDLERIGDLAANIAERAAFLATKEPVDIPFDFPGMSQLSESMLRRSLDALVNLDAKLAYEVINSDDAVDEMHREMYSRIQEEIVKRPEKLDCLINLLAVSRQLERIADHATNIAEDVIYMIEGEIVRHQAEGIYNSEKTPNK